MSLPTHIFITQLSGPGEPGHYHHSSYDFDLAVELAVIEVQAKFDNNPELTNSGYTYDVEQLPNKEWATVKLIHPSGRIRWAWTIHKATVSSIDQ